MEKTKGDRRYKYKKGSEEEVKVQRRGPTGEKKRGRENREKLKGEE